MCLFSFDVRGNQAFDTAIHWHDGAILGNRATFKWSRYEGHLAIIPVLKGDEDIYRCRVDFEKGATRNSYVNLTIIGMLKI